MFFSRPIQLYHSQADPICLFGENAETHLAFPPNALNKLSLSRSIFDQKQQKFNLSSRHSME